MHLGGNRRRVPLNRKLFYVSSGACWWLTKSILQTPYQTEVALTIF